jgi:dinuclear metal center YbgI/SA1388 family protein
MKIKEVVSYLNSKYPLGYQESYDNSGFQLGDDTEDIKGALIAVDLTLEVIHEAIEKGCNLIVTHHPFIFSGLKRITPQTYTGKMVYMLIKNNISVYAAHTNLDNLMHGVNGILSSKIGLEKTTILRPMSGKLRKLVVYCPVDYAEQVRAAMFQGGAGCIGNYDSCSFTSEGTGTFRAGDDAHPFVGEMGKLHFEKEVRIEVVYPTVNERQIISLMKDAHPYEEPAYDCLDLANPWNQVGAGMIGTLPTAMPTKEFLKKLKEVLNIPVVRHSELCKDTVQSVALCGGAGSFLIGDAKAQKADIYLTGDLKYHDFQQAENTIIIADIGHYESEQYTKELIFLDMSEKFSNFATQISTKSSGFVDYI